MRMLRGRQRGRCHGLRQTQALISASLIASEIAQKPVTMHQSDDSESMRQVVQYTPRGRAWNRNSGTLAGTANAAFLSLVYSKYVRQQKEYNQLQKRYVCWARGQMRYILGDSGRSLVAGYGKEPPTRVRNEAASCSPAPTVCNEVSRP